MQVLTPNSLSCVLKHSWLVLGCKLLFPVHIVNLLIKIHFLNIYAKSATPYA